MSRLTVDQSAVRVVVLDREDRVCPQCGGRMHVRCSRPRCIHSFNGPLQLDLELVRCSNAQCSQMKLFSPEQESGYAMPRWGIGRVQVPSKLLGALQDARGAIVGTVRTTRDGAAVDS